MIDQQVIIHGKVYGTVVFDADRKRAYFLPPQNQYLSDTELDSILRFVREAECRMVMELGGKNCGNINFYGQCACNLNGPLSDDYPTYGVFANNCLGWWDEKENL